MKLKDHIAFAYETFKTKKMRTALTLLGVVIGTLSVILIGSLSKSGRQVIFQELQTFGLKTVWLHRSYDQEDIRKKSISGSGIRYADLSLMDRYVDEIAPVVEQERKLAKFDRSYANVNIIATTHSYAKINNDSLITGRFFDQGDIDKRARLCVIGPEVAQKLFLSPQAALGKPIRIDTTKYTIIGVLKEKDRSFLESIGSVRGGDINARVIIPITLYMQQYNTKEISYIQASVNAPETARRKLDQMMMVLQDRYNGKFHYKGKSMQEYITTADTILGIVSFIGFAAAIVSLVVGGIGIMNIVSASVFERKKEIGIRRAIGAKKKDILMQFLVESGTIGFIGGITGVGLSLAVFGLIAMMTAYTPIIPSSYIFVAFLSALLTGIVSGVYPAIQAASLDPVEALR